MSLSFSFAQIFTKVLARFVTLFNEVRGSLGVFDEDEIYSLFDHSLNHYRGGET
jgi:hypothetical protein